jgi:hypothetical protein
VLEVSDDSGIEPTLKRFNSRDRVLHQLNCGEISRACNAATSSVMLR